jgi:endogenous inhibitor of DNA gyrase (YacG/DUF329 family)
MARRVPCPTCGTSVEWTETSLHRPFCSARCKTNDLGAWAAERYRVPVTEDKDDPDSSDATGDERGRSPSR